MNKKITIAILGISLLMTAGCADGPIRRFFRGGACNSCTPWLGNGIFGSKYRNRDDDVSCPGTGCPTCGATGFIKHQIRSAASRQCPGSLPCLARRLHSSIRMAVGRRSFLQGRNNSLQHSSVTVQEPGSGSFSAQ